MELTSMLSNKLFIAFTAIVLLASSCTRDTKEAETATVKITFDHKVGDQEFKMYEMIYESKAGRPYDIRTLRYFVSMFAFHGEDGNVFNTDTFHYVEEAGVTYLHTKTMHLNIPPGKYNAISFIHGFDDTYNSPITSSDPRSLPANVDEYNDMYWPWLEMGQYHFMKYEGFYKVGEEIKAFKLHTGPTDNNENYINVMREFDPVEINPGDTLNIGLMMDLAEWIDGEIIYDFAEYTLGIMDKQEPQDILKANGKNVYSINSVSLTK